MVDVSGLRISSTGLEVFPRSIRSIGCRIGERLPTSATEPKEWKVDRHMGEDDTHICASA